MKKLLLCFLILLLMFSLCACKPKPTEPDTPGLTEQPPAEEPPAEEPDSSSNMMQVNIYHLGIKTELDIKEEQTINLAGQLMELIESAAATDSMEAAPADALNPIQVMSGHTALELVYKQEVELPLTTEDEPMTARMLLYSIPVSSSDGGLLYVGHDIYAETPPGKLFNQALQNSIYNSACDQVERAIFAADGQQVIINKQEYAYVSGDDSVELSGRLLNRMLYRAIAFYLNAYTGNVNGLQDMSTNTLFSAVLQVKDGLDTGNELGEEIVANLNQYVLADYVLPQSIVAPVQQGGDDAYQVFLHLNEQVTVEIDFTVEEDTPLVSSFGLIMAEQ